MRSSEGERGELRLPRSRGARETLIALLALPVLLLVGVQIGEQLRDDPAAPVAGAPVASAPPAGSPPAVAVPQSTAPVPSSAGSPKAVPRTTKPAPKPVATRSAARPPVRTSPAATPPRAAGMANDDAPPPPDFLLSRGTTGAEVRQWQQRMAQRGWRIAVDGIYGPRSAAVARQFQAEKGLVVDGLVGPQTWRAAWRLPITP